MAALDSIDRTKLQGTSISEAHNKDFLDTVDAIFTRLNSVLDIDGSGNVTLYLNSAKDTYLKWNSSSSQIEFYISDVLEGYVDNTGFVST